MVVISMSFRYNGACQIHGGAIWKDTKSHFWIPVLRLSGRRGRHKNILENWNGLNTKTITRQTYSSSNTGSGKFTMLNNRRKGWGWVQGCGVMSTITTLTSTNAIPSRDASSPIPFRYAGITVLIAWIIQLTFGTPYPLPLSFIKKKILIRYKEGSL